MAVQADGVEPAVEVWAERIRPHLHDALEHILAAGRDLIAAKETLPHGDFLPLLDSLGLHPRTAQRLMAIARNQVLSTCDPHGSHVPSSWTTLSALSRLPNDVLVDAIEDGRVRPALQHRFVGYSRAEPLCGPLGEGAVAPRLPAPHRRSFGDVQ